ncbi:MAG TPA: transcriptional repressor [Cyclobacteriaceae bacterium]|nr:transcriptional repressor [Cyclobacteriaceae bacterium]
MNYAASDRLLKIHDLRSTPSRLTILHLFLKMERALSYADIENEINENLDRVTVYRTLKTFLDRGLIHKVLNDEGSLKYALCNTHCSSTLHHHDHVHFKCTNCGQTSCLDVDVPVVTLPKKFKIREINLLIHGICDQCSQ